MQFVNASAGDALRPRGIYRATWGRSLVGDLTDALTFGFHSEEQLSLWSAQVTARIPELGVGFRSAGPTVNEAADAFTADITILASLPAGMTVGRFADELQGIAGSSLALTRLELVNSAETSAQAAQGRAAATADAANEAGITGLPTTVANAAGKLILPGGILLYAVFFGAVLWYTALSPKARANLKKAMFDVY